MKEPEIEGTKEENAETLKKLGNEAFAAANYQKAIDYYSEALGNHSINICNQYRFHQERSDIDESCSLLHSD